MNEPARVGSVQYSVVIAVFNEEGNIDELYRRLTAVFRSEAASYEILFVDDGSTDNSLEKIQALHLRDARVRGLSFSRNFGHHLALTAGIDNAVGDAVILMDADLQDQPEEIPKLLKKFREGYDVVHGVRKNRKDPIVKRVSSHLFVAAMNRVIGSDQPLNSEIFRVMSRQVVDELKHCRESSRFITGLVGWLGFKQVGVEVEHGARFAGKSKYSVWKLIRLGMSTLTSFSYFPLQLATYLGLLVACCSVLIGLYVIYRKVFYGIPVQGYASFFAATALLGGTQLMMLGLIGEYIGRIYSESQGRPLYIVKTRIG